MAVEQEPPPISYGKRFPSQAMKYGMIVMWWRPIAEIPNGWGICDGTNGLPDLREYFIKGCAAGVDPGGTGGSVNHDHTFLSDSHTHPIPAGEYIAAGENYDDEVTATIVAGTTFLTDGQPPFYEMVFIGKL